MKNKTILALGFLILTTFSCKKDDNPIITPDDHHEEELITTFRITFSDTSGIEPNFIATFKDIDGPGGNSPSQFDTIKLKLGVVYEANIEFLNESVNPTASITEEILAEAVDHLICFQLSSTNHSIVRIDSDGTYEIGLKSLWTIGNSGLESVIIRLKHQPGVKNGTCDPGATDIEINFPFISFQ
jgi:predicted  nucleic acid-binding Zn-ribbon protein